MNNDGWTTVPSRPVFGQSKESNDRPVFGRGQPRSGGGPAPAAFGGGGQEKAEQRRQAAEARTAFQAAEAREQKKIETAAAAKQAEAENFASETSYPSLASASTVGAPKSAMNYKQVVKDMIAREAEAQVAAAAAAEAATYSEMMAPAAPARSPTTYRQRILDELEDDYSGPEEDEDEEDEHNADIGSGRRRGDKGIW